MTPPRIQELVRGLDWKKAILFLLLAATLTGVVARVYRRAQAIAPLSPQSRFMLDRSVSLSATMDPDIFPGAVWPPGYPLVLLSARHAGFPVGMVNLVLFLGALALVFLVSRTAFPDVSPWWATLLFGLCGFNYYNLPQYTSEALVIPLSLLILVSLERLFLRSNFRAFALLSLACSLLFITRYHAFLWLAPVVFGNLFFLAFKLRKMPVWQALVSIALAILPLCAVLFLNYQNTGYPTGMGRFDWSARESSAYIETFENATTLSANLARVGTIYWLDFGSPFVHATHAVLLSKYRFTNFEIVSALLFFLAVGALLVALIDRVRHKRPPTLAALASHRSSLMGLLILEFLGMYLFITLLFWTIGNNDPLYTRYLYPSHVYLILGMFAGYSFIRRRFDSLYARIPFQVLYGYILAVNLYKIIDTIFLQNKLVYSILPPG